MTGEELNELRRLASIAGITDRAAAVRLHAIIFALESLLARLDSIEPFFGIEPPPRLERRRPNA